VRVLLPGSVWWEFTLFKKLVLTGVRSRITPINKKISVPSPCLSRKGAGEGLKRRSPRSGVFRQPLGEVSEAGGSLANVETGDTGWKRVPPIEHYAAENWAITSSSMSKLADTP
jgi:hypothetical protein